MLSLLLRTLAVVPFLLFCLSASAGGRSETIFQVSTLDALIEGDFAGRMRFRKLAHRGDFGLGTFDRLDGEMVALGGSFYRVRTDGAVYPVEACETTPFAAVTFFAPETSFHLNDAATCADVFSEIESRMLPSKLPLAIQIEGQFSKLETRSVPVQSKPYPPLATVIAQETLFDLYDVEATLVGFWFPETFGGINAAGFHFHALTDDMQAGGHVLDCNPGRIRIEIDAKKKLVTDLASGRSQTVNPARCSR
ncbi:acetolactate decarboxylase [Myxococcota bacterium]|nr:acetolactate decarboxylase [Myxococcota bacterium]